MSPTVNDDAGAEPRPPEIGYLALFLRFLRFGLLAFGGPVAQIAMIRRELVDEERWIGSGGFNRLLAVMQALPGPEAHELCVHLGIRAKGRLGGLLAGLGFMLPGFVLMMVLAWGYSRLRIEGTVLGAMFLGVQAAVLAVIARAIHRIGQHILLDRWLWAAMLGAAARPCSAPASGSCFRQRGLLMPWRQPSASSRLLRSWPLRAPSASRSQAGGSSLWWSRRMRRRRRRSRVLRGIEGGAC